MRRSQYYEIADLLSQSLPGNTKRKGAKHKNMNDSSSQAQRPPATPTYILRGHAAPIHALHLFANNLRLMSGDAEGWIVIWDMVSKRPVASWKAHEGAVLEAKGYKTKPGMDIYTHGRDHKLRVWRIRIQDEDFLDKSLPVDRKDAAVAQLPKDPSQPWLLHSLPVNALNFCAFGMLFLKDSIRQQEPSTDSSQASSDDETQLSALIAVPNALNSGAIDIFHLPSERRISTIPADTDSNTGMVMAVHLLVSPSSGKLYATCGYEDGRVMVFVRRCRLEEQDVLAHVNGNSSPWKWEKSYSSRPHTQPVLSLDVAPAKDYFLSSSADAALVKHPIPTPSAVPGHIEESPLRTVNTKHSGQQGLRIRSDGKIFATAGWDCRIRVYSCKTMRELAVLKWHQDGCYAAALAEISTDSVDANSTSPAMASRPQSQNEVQHENSQIIRRDGGSSLVGVQRQRNQKTQKTHWLVAGSKDGKISLWDIY